MVSILITSDSRYKIDRKFLRSVVVATLKQEGISENAEISLSVVGRRKMRALTDLYFHDEIDHDVFSFPLEENFSQTGFVGPDVIRRLGDIVVSYPAAVQQAFDEQVLLNDKFRQLIEHAIMHLLGHHHGDEI